MSAETAAISRRDLILPSRGTKRKQRTGQSQDYVPRAQLALQSGGEPPQPSGISRRAVVLGTAAATGILVIGGGAWLVKDKLFHEGNSTPAETLVEFVDELSPSLVKTLLTDRIVPYFKRKKPFEQNEGGFQFPVYDVTITEQSSSEGVHGTYSSRGNAKPAGFILTEDFTLPIPLGPLTQSTSIRDQFDKDHRMPDGTPFSTQPFQKGNVVFEGISPHINIFSRPLEHVRPELRDSVISVRRFAYMKEACSFLIDDLLNLETYNTLKSNSIPTTVKALSEKDNVPTEMEIVHQLTRDIYNTNGGWKAVIDIAGYLVAFKAFENNADMMRSLSLDARFEPVLRGIRTLNLGADAKSLLYGSIKWLYDHPESDRLPHKDTNLYQIP